MPGSNAGTGHPLTLRCTKCKRYRNYLDPAEHTKGCRLEATGRTRPRERGGGARTTGRMVEYRCLTCGHVGWTIHIAGEDLLRRKLGAKYQAPDRSANLAAVGLSACAVRERTADGRSVGRCWHFVGEEKRCPLHGDVAAVQRRFAETGKLTDERELAGAA